MKCMPCLGVVVRLNSFRGFNLAHNREIPGCPHRVLSTVFLSTDAVTPNTRIGNAVPTGTTEQDAVCESCPTSTISGDPPM